MHVDKLTDTARCASCGDWWHGRARVPIVAPCRVQACSRPAVPWDGALCAEHYWCPACCLTGGTVALERAR